MKHDPEQFDPEDPALDALLAEARWPEPDTNSTRRLASFYRSQRHFALDRRWLVAASLLIACAIVLSILRWKHASHPVATGPHRQTPVQVDPPQNSEPLEIIARPPTRLELARLTAAEHEARRPKPVQPDDPIRRAILQIADDDSADSFTAATRILQSLPQRLREARLARIYYSNDLPTSRAAARLIAHFANSQSIPLLLDIDRSTAMRDLAIPALAQFCQPQLLAKLACSHTDPDQRQTLIAGLLTREAASQYLDLLLDPPTSADAMAALDRVSSPSTDGFFLALNDPHISVREAAARVLGHIDGPQTTARLVAMAESNRSRREALIALADSRDPEARHFLSEARTGGPLAGAVRSVLLEQATNQ